MADMPTYTNTIVVDPREGSGDLLAPLKELHLPVMSLQVPFGDVHWAGSGPRGETLVGVELKRLKDALNSMRTGRFAGHQLPGLVQTYEYVYLLVEGVWREEPGTGILQEYARGGWRDVLVGQSRFRADELENWLTSMETKYGLHVRRADNWQQTVFTIARLYKWWQKPWEKHSSGKVLYTPPAPTVLTTRVPLVQRLANCLEGVGWERSAAIAARFPTAVDMIATTEADWELIPGIGKTLAKRIVRSLCTKHGEKDEL